MKELIELYLAFLKIGAVNFGGGYAMLPLLEEELNKKRGWVTTEELMDYFAIGQCTPGVIALNVSTFIGNKRHGVVGAAVASIGFLTCPIILILIIAAFLTNFADIPIVKNAFAGIRVCVCVLILEAVLRLWKKSVVDKIAFVIYLIIFLLMVFSSLLPVKVPAAVLVIAAGVAGVMIRGNKEVSK
ncbi:MAG: chromate transporter [Lachnospiraceae bacterium]|nr:chromate transporter [Lachnospiraceae bacterium]